jgi:hypothetical protein
LQKFYGREVETGDTCGIYIFDSSESLHAFHPDAWWSEVR